MAIVPGVRERPPAVVAGSQGHAPLTEGDRWWPARLGTLLGVTVVWVPLVVAIVVAARDGLPLAQDQAVIDLRARDLLGPDRPLTGAYSRFGWNHPGPWQLWLSGVVQVLLGQQAWAAVAGQALQQALAVGATIVMAARIGRGSVAASLAVLALALAVLGPRGVLDPWNPYAAYPFAVAFVVACWWLAHRRPRPSPVAAVVVTGSYLVQTHLGYAPLVAAGLVWAIWRSLRAVRIDHQTEDGGAPTKCRWPITIGIGLALWAPVAADTVTRPPGNVVAVARFFSGRAPHPDGSTASPNGPTIGAVDGAGLVADAFRVPPPWLGGSSGSDPVMQVALPASIAWLLVPAALLAGGLVLARAADAGALVRLIELLALLTAVGVMAAGRLPGPPEPHMVLWRTPLAVGVVAVFIGSALAAGQRWRPTGRFGGRVGLPIAAGVVGVSSIVLSWSVIVAAERGDPFRFATAQLVGALESALPSEPVVIVAAGPALGGLHGGIVNELDRRGHDVRVARGSGFHFGYSREVADEGAVQWHVFEAGHYAVTANVDALVAFTTPLDDRSEAELRLLQRTAAKALTDVGRPDLLDTLDSPLADLLLADVEGITPSDRRRLAALNTTVVSGPSCRCGVYVTR